uniref:Potassium channel blocker pMeKTx20-1a n=1 Tax=Mesobuthus eupeus TaxID=34648 RepID=A0A088DB34_MESEU|nr:potassium channel blocker pMeKTx20-1a [Mesobuthus eupeus]
MKLTISFLILVLFSVFFTIEGIIKWFPASVNGKGHSSCSNGLEMTEEDFCKMLCGIDGKLRESKCVDHWCYCSQILFP